VPLWTLFGLWRGQATTSWPKTATAGQNTAGQDATGQDATGQDTAGQEGVLGMPRFAPERCAPDCDECAAACPTTAITVAVGQTGEERLSVDYGRCVVCQLCVEACPADAAMSSFDWAFGTRDRADLLLTNGIVADARTAAAPRTGFRRSLHIRHVDAGSCNGCESELQALNNPFYNLGAKD